MLFRIAWIGKSRNPAVGGSAAADPRGIEMRNCEDRRLCKRHPLPFLVKEYNGGAALEVAAFGERQSLGAKATERQSLGATRTER